MQPRFLMLLLVLSAFGCARRGGTKHEPREQHVSAAERRLADYILDEAPRFRHPLAVEFGNKVELLGYDVEPEGVIPQSKRIRLTLYWRLKSHLKGNWKLLTHVLDDSGKRILDLYDASPIRQGRRGHPLLRPSSWKTGKVYVDELGFQLPHAMHSSRISIVASVYSTASVRLPVTKGKGDDWKRALVANLDVGLETPSVVLEKLAPKAAIAIDGKLSEDAWQDAPVLGPFMHVKVAGADDAGGPVSVGGKARMLWDDRGLYLAYEVQDADVEGGFPRGKLDPDLWTQDTVALTVEPQGDGKDVYELAINPQNIVCDVSRPAAGGGDVNGGAPEKKDWRSNVKSAVVVNGTLDEAGDEDRGYVVEAMIPWRSFADAGRQPPKPGDTWKMNLYALQKSTGVGWGATFGKESFGAAPRFGAVKFVEKAAAPAASASASASAAPSGTAAAPRVPSARTASSVAPPSSH